MFGVLVTTSYLNPQAYAEFKADGHPIVVIAGRDMSTSSKANGYGDAEAVRRWLRREFPRPAEPVDRGAQRYGGQRMMAALALRSRALPWP